MASLGHPSKFQRVISRLGFVTAATSLNVAQPNFAGCLAVFWAGTLYIHFPGFYPVPEFCHVQNSFCVQVLRSPILAALLHAALDQWSSAKVCGVAQGMELRNFRRRHHLYSTAGRPSRWASAHILVIGSICFFIFGGPIYLNINVPGYVLNKYAINGRSLIDDIHEIHVLHLRGWFCFYWCSRMATVRCYIMKSPI